ncbi:MAG TPA: antibiotic biosynthesis monooxygenase [Candidatus Dormibacteraeota bacterium]|nr:antibiotic biosynthesis monooxygenase [Candidatus Dormibacteraeota bacterium]
MVVVLFSINGRDDLDAEDYSRTSARMREIVAGIPGFISYNSYEGEDGDGIVVARFQSHEALKTWRTNAEHLIAQQKGRDSFYSEYWVQVCETVREYRYTPSERYTHDLAHMFRSNSAIRAQPIP